MGLSVREMRFDETDLIINYFHRSTPKALETMGVDPTRLPAPEAWRERFRTDLGHPIDHREGMLVIWLSDGRPVGFSTADKIVYGDQARMHLHVLDPANRRRGTGVECVRQSVELYFDRLKLKNLYCEPNALNIAPNRTLQKAGFKYLETYMTVPGWLNFHQPVTRWVIGS
jgi:RimJ/RimL family protein N-acetyltransferase